MNQNNNIIYTKYRCNFAIVLINILTITVQVKKNEYGDKN